MTKIMIMMMKMIMRLFSTYNVIIKFEIAKNVIKNSKIMMIKKMMTMMMMKLVSV